VKYEITFMTVFVITVQLWARWRTATRCLGDGEWPNAKISNYQLLFKFL